MADVRLQRLGEHREDGGTICDGGRDEDEPPERLLHSGGGPVACTGVGGGRGNCVDNWTE
ncbi:hypothetical protein EYF80_059941 [Liparis tanakae]|uniref:Uncharacterized protein n=1 Tax=Liparis tanakae TaxID=230148 RepID=A0A4Z2EMC9_9TELE|nr:hypothetical protein EYF80_059941 [Liparis tanakae]